MEVSVRLPARGPNYITVITSVGFRNKNIYSDVLKNNIDLQVFSLSL